VGEEGNSRPGWLKKRVLSEGELNPEDKYFLVKKKSGLIRDES
jgi:hypothetical protein